MSFFNFAESLVNEASKKARAVLDELDTVAGGGPEQSTTSVQDNNSSLLNGGGDDEDTEDVVVTTSPPPMKQDDIPVIESSTEASSLRAQLNEHEQAAKQREASLVQKLSALKKVHLALKSAKEETDEKLAMALAERPQLMETIDAAQAEVKKWEERADALSQENSVLLGRSHDVERLNKQVQDMSKAMEPATARIIELETQAKTWEERAEMLLKENSSLLVRVDDVDRLTKQVEELSKQPTVEELNVAHNARVAELEERAETLSKENSSLLVRVDDIDRLTKQVEELSKQPTVEELSVAHNARVAELEERAETLSKENSSLLVRVDDIDRLTKQVEELSKQPTVEELNVAHNARVAELEERAETLSKENSSLLLRVEELSSTQHIITAERIDLLTKEKAAILEDRNRMLAENTTLINRVHELSIPHDAVNDAVSQGVLVDRLERKLAKVATRYIPPMENYTTNTEIDCRIIVDRLERRLAKQGSELMVKNNELQGALRQLQIVNEVMQTDITDKEIDLRVQLDRMERRMTKSLRNGKHVVGEEVPVTSMSIENEVNLRIVMDRLERRLAAKNRELETTHNALETKLQVTMEELATIKSQYNDAIATNTETQTQAVIMARELQSTRTQLADALDKISSFQAETQVRSHADANIESQLKVCQDQLCEIKAEYTVLQSRLEEKEKALSVAQKQASDAVAAHANMELELKDVVEKDKKAMGLATKACTELQEANFSLDKDMEIMKTEKTVLSKSLEDACTQIESLRGECANLAQLLHTAQDEKLRLSTSLETAQNQQQIEMSNLVRSVELLHAEKASLIKAAEQLALQNESSMTEMQNTMQSTQADLTSTRALVTTLQEQLQKSAESVIPAQTHNDDDHNNATTQKTIQLEKEIKMLKAQLVDAGTNSSSMTSGALRGHHGKSHRASSSSNLEDVLESGGGIPQIVTTTNNAVEDNVTGRTILIPARSQFTGAVLSARRGDFTGIGRLKSWFAILAYTAIVHLMLISIWLRC